MLQVFSSRTRYLLLTLCALTLAGCGSGPTDPEASGLERLINLLKPAPQNTVKTLETLADTLLTKGQHELAEEHYRQALRIREAAWGAKHLQVTPGLDHLAALYTAQGKYPEAELSMQQALAIREKQLGAEHPDVAATLERYAALLRQLRRDAEAQPLAARAQVIRTQLAQAQRRT